MRGAAVALWVVDESIRQSGLGVLLIREIQRTHGVTLSLRTNAGAPNEEGEVYPAVVGLTWDFDGKQQTILHLSDERGVSS